MAKLLYLKKTLKVSLNKLSFKFADFGNICQLFDSEKCFDEKRHPQSNKIPDNSRKRSI